MSDGFFDGGLDLSQSLAQLQYVRPPPALLPSSSFILCPHARLKHRLSISPSPALPTEN
jgi:hypothetical protein